MAKKDQKQESDKQDSPEMSMEEARAYRASLYKPAEVKLSESEIREKFRLFWAQEKKKYNKTKDLEHVLWVHLKAAKLDSPEKFEEGMAHFGLKKVK